MKAFSIFALSVAAAGTLSACGTADNFGACNEDHTFGCPPYTEERTVKATPKTYQATPVMEAAPQPAPAPAPAEEKIMMQSAEPQFTHRSK